MKQGTIMSVEETSVGCTYSQSFQEGVSKRFCKRVDKIEEDYQPKNDWNHLVMKRISSLEDLVWKLYDELDNKIQDIFEEHTNKFKQQNDIITNIFHGFGQEISFIKEEVQMNSQKIMGRQTSQDVNSEENKYESEGVPNNSPDEHMHCKNS